MPTKKKDIFHHLINYLRHPLTQILAPPTNTHPPPLPPCIAGAGNQAGDARAGYVESDDHAAVEAGPRGRRETAERNGGRAATQVSLSLSAVCQFVCQFV